VQATKKGGQAMKGQTLVRTTEELKRHLENKCCGPVSVKNYSYILARREHPGALGRGLLTGVNGGVFTIEVFKRSGRLYWRRPIGNRAKKAREIAIEFLEARGIHERSRVY